MFRSLGPSVEHVIKTQPLVVDLLLSFAFSAAKSRTRMDMPQGLQSATILLTTRIRADNAASSYAMAVY